MEAATSADCHDDRRGGGHLRRHGHPARADDAEKVLSALGESDPRLVSAATFVELGIVLEARLGPAGSAIAERLLRDAGIEVVDLDRTHADRALEGWRRFGKGRHRDGLNLGDCFAYGLAMATGQPVLCVGDDFTRTDAEVLPGR